MNAEPTLWTRVVSRLHGEIPADTLEAYRRAGADVYALMDDLDARRAEWTVRGVDAWSVDHEAQSALLCGWNAFALQILGDELVAADYASSTSTVGYVPPVTAEQALSWYEQVPAWLARSRRALSSSQFMLDVSVPAPLPRWSQVEPCPVSHLAAMRAALDRMRQHTSAAMTTLHDGLDGTDQTGEAANEPSMADAEPRDGDETSDRRRAHDRIHELLAGAEASASYADRLWTPSATRQVHEQVEVNAKQAIEGYYIIGQLLAMPPLALSSIPAGPSTTLPGNAAGRLPTDPWVLTDPVSKARWQADPQAVQAINELWARDPDPSLTLGLQSEIDAALARGDIAFASSRSGATAGHFYCCPWAPIYEVRRRVWLGGRWLAPISQFSLDISAEAMETGGPFRREVVLGPFRSTSEVDYCLPGGEQG